VNYSESIESVFNAFNEVGDYARGGFIEDLAYILDQGIKVAMVYGDRDFVGTTTLFTPSNHVIANNTSAGMQLDRRRSCLPRSPLQPSHQIQSCGLHQSGGKLVLHGRHGTAIWQLQLHARLPSRPRSPSLPARNRVRDLPPRNEQPGHSHRHQEHDPPGREPGRVCHPGRPRYVGHQAGATGGTGTDVLLA